MSSPRPDLSAYDAALRMPPGAIVAELAEILGKKLVALLAGVRDTAIVDGWIQGREAGHPFDVERLRFALRIAKMLRSRDDKRVVQAWFLGLNPGLGDRSPARVLRDAIDHRERDLVSTAARASLVNG